MPPKPTRTPERISLPGGWYIEQFGDMPVLCTPDGIKLWGCMDWNAQAFAAAMNGLQSPAPVMDLSELTRSELEDLAKQMKKGGPISVLQSPAGEWRDISTAPKSPERFDAYARYYSNLGKKWLYRRIPDCVMHHEDTDFVCRPDDYREWEVTHWHTIPLPPAPTGEG